MNDWQRAGRSPPASRLESDLDNALARAGMLMAAMATGRERAKDSAVVGADAFDHLGKTVAALFESRGSIVALHLSLDETRAQLRLPETGVRRRIGKGSGACRRECRTAADRGLTMVDDAASDGPLEP